MAKIVSSDLAPSEAVHYVLGNTEFDIGGSGKGSSKSYETDDPVVLSDAEVHPWLAVEYDPVEQVAGAYVEQLAPQNDHLSVLGETVHPNDPDAAQAAEEAKAEAVGDTLTAVEAGKPQTEAVTAGGQGDAPAVAETLAADPTSKTEDKS